MNVKEYQEKVKQAEKIYKEIKKEGGEPMERLAAKCQWEHMIGVAVIMEWGDPREW